MKVTTTVEIQADPIELTHPFEYFLDTLSALPYATITVKTPDGFVGQGEVACALDINGESIESACKLAGPLTAILSSYLIESEDEIVAVMEECDLRLACNTASKCGLEQALYDILAQRMRTPLATLLSAQKENVQIQCTVPFHASREEYQSSVTTILAKEPLYIKFKIGRNFELEAQAILDARAQDAKVSISVDANQAFPSATEAVSFLRKIESAQIAWAEQLLHRNDIEGLIALKAQTDTPLMLDESIHTAQDARWYLDRKLVDMINIKLAKCGGILEARKILALAKEYRVPCMLGSMLHGENGLRYNLAFGLSQDFVTYDFFSYFSLKKYHQAPLIDETTLTTTAILLS